MRHSAIEGAPVSVLGRAMSILTAFREGETVLSLTELSNRAGVPKSTTHRLVKELAEWGLVECTNLGVSLGLRMFELGNLVARQRQLRDLASPVLSRLHSTTGLTVHLAVMEEAEVLYLEKLTASGAPQIPSRVGGRMPAHCTAVGKVLLAGQDADTISAAASRLGRRTPRSIVMGGMLIRELGAVREHQLAFDREECAVGVTCIAVPVADSSGSAVAAVSLSGRSSQMRPDPMARALRATSAEITRSMHLLDAS